MNKDDSSWILAILALTLFENKTMDVEEKKVEE